MSIIHQALKKAAAEGQIAQVQPPIVKTHAARLFPRSYFLIFLSGLVLLFFFILSGKRLFLSFYGSSPITEAKTVITPPGQIPDLTLSTKNTSLGESSASETKSGSHVQDGEAALAAGFDFYGQGKIELANESFAKAVLLLPFSEVAHNNLGLTLRSLGNVNEAIEHYQEAIRLNSNYAEGHNNLGMAYDQLGSIDQAASYYQKAIRLKSKVPEFHLNYATWLERKGDFLKARMEYQMYLTLASDLQRKGKATPLQKESIALVQARLAELKGL